MFFCSIGEIKKGISDDVIIKISINPKGLTNYKLTHICEAVCKAGCNYIKYHIGIFLLFSQDI